jgi:hypothetical protein
MLNWFVFGFGLLLPVSWAKHWLTASSLVNGVLVDYLMPDLWLQDILALIIIGLYLIKSDMGKIIKRIRISQILGLFLIGLSIYFSSFSLVSVINFLRFITAFGLGLVIIRDKQLRKKMLFGLAGSVVWVTVLGVGQFIYQGTVFGWKFLGEPIFSLGTGGIKKISLFGVEFLAPMATFPHANVMGVFGVLTFYLFKDKQHKVLKTVKFFSLALAMLSFSFPVYLSLLYLLILSLIKRGERKEFSLISLLIWAGLSLILIFVSYQIGLIEPSSVYRRLGLARASWKLIVKNLLFGVGWGTFVSSLVGVSAEINFLQPVHNVYLLVLAELGIIGTGGLILLLKDYLKEIGLLPTIIITFLFLFDHYFWTTTQGVYLLFIFLSLGRK